MKIRYVFLVLLTGMAIGYLYPTLHSRFNPLYFSREEAIEKALYNARWHCMETRYTHRVDCQNFILSEIEEVTSGWWITFRSADRRRSDSMRIGRRGEYDSTGGENLDGMAADGITENAPPANAKATPLP